MIADHVGAGSSSKPIGEGWAELWHLSAAGGPQRLIRRRHVCMRATCASRATKAELTLSSVTLEKTVGSR